jgi:hypothetical protein
MADHVLTEDEEKFLQDNKQMIVDLAKNEFAGHIKHHQRTIMEAIAWKVNGRSFPICWTCGGSTRQVGRLLNSRL